MINQNTLIVGRTGSGKTVLVKALLALTARAVVLDCKWEYSVHGAHISYTLRDAVAYFLRHRWGPFILVCRFERNPDYLRILEIAEHAQKTEPHGPVVFVVEESTRYMGRGSIPEFWSDLYTQGRHRRISLLTIVQFDTYIDHMVREQSEVWVMCAQHGISGPMKARFDERAVSELVSLREEWQNGNRVTEPVQGRNFLVYPDHHDLYDEWVKLHGWIAEPETPQITQTGVVQNGLGEARVR